MTAPAVQRPVQPTVVVDAPHRRLLRWAAVLYVLAVLAHGGDHLRRGVDVVTVQVRSAGQVQLLLAIVVLVLALREHRWAAPAAAGIGLGWIGARAFVRESAS